jgi:formiminoglutamase
MDGFSSAYAPGVRKVISCNIAELNPTVDQDNITANLAAKLVDYIASIH